MKPLEPSYSITLHEEHCELHFRIAGFWDAGAMWDFQHELNRTVLPLYQAGKPIHAMGEMSEFVPQSRATSEAIREHLSQSREFGLKKVAIVNPSNLVRDQYRRVSAGIEVEFFENRFDAIRWLRRGDLCRPSKAL